MFIINTLEEIRLNIKLEEDVKVIEDILFLIYIHDGIANKDIADKLYLSIDTTATIKNELRKIKFIKQEAGIKLTEKGIDYVENELKYKGFNKELYFNLIDENVDYNTILKDEILALEDIFNNRPNIDTSIDQSKCTLDTNVKRALLALRNNTLIGKNILCLGDDDLISITLGIIVNKLFNLNNNLNCNITVVDIDDRILDYISNLSQELHLPITVLKYDVRDLFPVVLTNTFDCLFLDPPFTTQGLELFLSRGIFALKKESCLPIFLSFADKPCDTTLNIQKSFNKMGLIIKTIYNKFNKYNGYKILPNTSNLIVLMTTNEVTPMYTDEFPFPIYTHEIKKKTQTYKCENCKKQFKVGFEEKFKTIDELVEVSCEYCNDTIFTLVDKDRTKHIVK